MTDREKLIELLNAVDGVCPKDASCYDCEYKDVVHCAIPAKADYLIANGVTVQKWISAKDRLPEPFVSVLVQMPGEEPFPTVREGFISNDGIWQSAMFRRDPGEVTHWQPMPQPPKGE